MIICYSLCSFHKMLSYRDVTLWKYTLQRRCIIPFLIFQEPAFQELIILYSDDDGQSDERDKSEMLPPQLKIYEKIPIPDLPVSAIPTSKNNHHKKYQLWLLRWKFWPKYLRCSFKYWHCLQKPLHCLDYINISFLLQ